MLILIKDTEILNLFKKNWRTEMSIVIAKISIYYTAVLIVFGVSVCILLPKWHYNILC